MDIDLMIHSVDIDLFFLDCHESYTNFLAKIDFFTLDSTFTKSRKEKISARTAKRRLVEIPLKIHSIALS